jgi:hypothetical protein
MGASPRLRKRCGGGIDLAYPDLVDHRVYQWEDDMKETDSETIAKRAYEKFVRRGGGHGHHEKDWLEAEKEAKDNKVILDDHYRDNNRMFQGHGERGHRHGGSG